VPDLSRASPDVTPGPLVPVDDPADPRLDLYRHLKEPAARIRLGAQASVFVVEGRLAVDGSSPRATRSVPCWSTITR